MRRPRVGRHEEHVAARRDEAYGGVPSRRGALRMSCAPASMCPSRPPSRPAVPLLWWATSRPRTPPDGIDPQVVARFLPLLQEYSRSNSQTMQLLYALRPFLKESKQDKVERAARLARLIHLGKKFLIDWGDGHV